MIIVLDPALFWTRSATGLIPEAELAEIEACLDDAVRICRATGGRIPRDPDYWTRLQKELAGPLVMRARRPRLQLANMALQGFTGSLPAGRTPGTGRARMWSVRPLFGWSNLAPGWFEAMEQLLLRCALTGERGVVITRPIEGRNVRRHAVGRCELMEKTRWRVYVHASGAPPWRADCVTHPRNLSSPWTSRFDHRLPGPEDGARYPFCPPLRWWDRDVSAHSTVESKPAWVDRRGSAWIRPATGGGHHWDVFIRDVSTAEQIGLDQLNIVEWGAPPGQGKPGDIHHVPTGKAGRLKSDPGWSCD